MVDVWDIKYEKWRRWLTDTIYHESVDLLVRREIWTGLLDLIQSDDPDERPSDERDPNWYAFFTPFTRMYIDGQAMEVFARHQPDDASIGLHVTGLVLPGLMSGSRALARRGGRTHGPVVAVAGGGKT